MTPEHVLIRALRDAGHAAVARFTEAECGALVMSWTLVHPG